MFSFERKNNKIILKNIFHKNKIMFLYEKLSEKYIKLGNFVSFNVRCTF